MVSDLRSKELKKNKLVSLREMFDQSGWNTPSLNSRLIHLEIKVKRAHEIVVTSSFYFRQEKKLEQTVDEKSKNKDGDMRKTPERHEVTHKRIEMKVKLIRRFGLVGLGFMAYQPLLVI